ncbi:MAG TPA: hypothetical protein VE967_17160 [Gemmatimonadaceae bacterium]|nr:hypothetical protein [Gemmatimonadaceae bacterium]
MTNRIWHVLTCTVLLAVSACGSDSGTDSISESFSIFSGDAELNANAAEATLAGSLLTIHAEGTSGEIKRVLTLQATATTTGTFTVGATNGATVRYSEIPVGATSGKEWLAAAGAGSGTFTLTEFSATRVTGTLSAVLPPVSASGATATKTLTNGTFTLKLFHQ